MYTYWGTGTMLYGNRDKDPNDGSYIASEWITILFLPIIPLGSYRVWKIEGGKDITSTPFFISIKTQLRRKKVKWHWSQIFKTAMIPISILIIFIISLLTEYLYDKFVA